MWLSETQSAADDLLERVLARIEARLDSRSPAPVAIAFSGGGDSMALLLIVALWARRVGRRLVALTVDHRLQAAAAEWSKWCARRAAALGVEHRALVWPGEGADRARPAVARRARHALLADAARDIGARVLLMGHTADDRLEAQAMRASGRRLGDPAEFSPSPVWPEGRGLFLVRPLLGESRQALRAMLLARGEVWIEDPANDAPQSLRARVRADIAERGRGPSPSPAPRGAALAGLDQVRCGRSGDITLAEEAWRGLDGVSLARFLSVAMVCAGGGEGTPRASKVARMAVAVCESDGPARASLAGARLVADLEAMVLTRESGEFRRFGAPRTFPVPGVSAVWDGRFAIEAQVPGLEVRPLAGFAHRLAGPARAALAREPAAARPALPCVLLPDGGVDCPILAHSPRVRARSLIAERLMGALGGAGCEREAAMMARGLATP